MKTQFFNLNLFTDQESDLLEVIFQKTPRPDGTTIEKTSMAMQISSKIIWEWFLRRRRKSNQDNSSNKEEKTPDTKVIDQTLPEKIFNCIFCEKVSCFKSRQPCHYERHLKSRHKVSFQMNILHSVNFFKKEKKKNIIEEAKKNIKKGDLFRCSLCQGEHNFVVGQFEEFKQHLERIHQISYETGFVLAISFFSTDLKTIVLQESKNSEMSNMMKIACNLCTYTTLSARPMQKILRHKTKIHNVCKVCETKFEKRKELTMHFHFIHWVGDTNVKCAIDGCTKVTREKDVHLHVQRHHKSKVLFKCEETGVVDGKKYKCDKEYTNSFDLQKHKEKGHIVFKSRTCKPKILKETFSVPCTICGIMVKERSMSSHIERIRGDNPFLNCIYCKFTTKYSKYMKSHEAGHLGVIRCEPCDISFRSKPLLRKHQVIVHGDGKHVSCPLCSFKTWNPTLLRIHSTTHNEKTFKCNQCDYKGTSKDNLRNHKRRHEEPKYICQKCDYKTYDCGNFHTHSTVKHGTIVLKCEYCPEYSTKSARSLRKHQEGHIRKYINK